MSKQRRIKDAVKDFNSWKNQAVIYHNLVTGDTWTTRAERGRPIEFNHPDIVRLRGKNDDKTDTTSVKEIKERIGWRTEKKKWNIFRRK